MMGLVFTLAIAAVPAFVASIVEWVEAFTIVLAVGNTRGWRSPIWGTLAGLGSLAVIVGVFDTPLIIFHEQVSQSFHIVVGVLLPGGPAESGQAGAGIRRGLGRRVLRPAT